MRFELATTENSLARVSGRNPRRLSPPVGLPLRCVLSGGSAIARRGATDRHVSGSFHRPPGLLFNFRSNYWCAIGLGTYLGLGSLRSHVRPQIPMRPTLHCGSTHRAFAYGAVTLFGVPFQAASATPGEVSRTTSPTSYEVGFSLACARFARRYYGHRICFLFLPVP